MQLLKAALSLAFFAGSVLAQGVQVTYPPSGSTLTVGDNFTVQISMNDYISNEDFVAIAIGLAPCYGGMCYPSSTLLGDVLYQGPYTREPNQLYANYSLMVPETFPPGNASLGVIDFYLVGASFEPVIQYLNVNLTVAAAD